MAVLLAACAGAPPAPSPGDFPLRASNQPPFVVSWRLTEAPGEVRATGVLDIDGYADWLADATVELVGLDADGRVVTRGIDLLGPPRLRRGRRLAIPDAASPRPAARPATPSACTSSTGKSSLSPASNPRSDQYDQRPIAGPLGCRRKLPSPA